MPCAIKNELNEGGFVTSIVFEAICRANQCFVTYKYAL